jgi:hypothetical protein
MDQVRRLVAWPLDERDISVQLVVRKLCALTGQSFVVQKFGCVDHLKGVDRPENQCTIERVER